MFYISKEDNIGSSVKDFTKAFLDEVEKALIEDNYQPCAEKESHIKIELHAIGIKEGVACTVPVSIIHIANIVSIILLIISISSIL